LNYCEWAGVSCAQSEPSRAHVQSIAVSSNAALQELPPGNIDVAQPLAKRAEASFTYIPSFFRAGYESPPATYTCATVWFHAAVNTKVADLFVLNGSMTGEMECRALPELETVVLGNEVWGVLPDSWASGSQLSSLKAVYLLGDNFIHALHPGALCEFHSPETIPGTLHTINGSKLRTYMLHP
jgi:hypothetical protein